MKVSELKKILEQSKFGKAACYQDEEVMVILSEPSLGFHAAAGIKNAYWGIDWDNGRLLLYPDRNLVTQKEEEALWQAAHDFIYQLSEQKTYKGNPTYLARRAQSILDRAKGKK